MMELREPQFEKLLGSAQYEAAYERLLARPQRTLRIFDLQLGKSFNAAARYELLCSFLLASRANRLQIVLHDASTLTRDCPRMGNLLRRFSHAVSIHETEPQARGVYDPFAIADERDYLHRFHHAAARSLLALDDVQGARGFVDRFNEIWEASVPAASATTLGL
jgi:hypothetical protein